MDHKGLFIVFEGGEGCGKTTQIRLLKNHLEKSGHEVILTQEPGGFDCPIGAKIREILLAPEYESMLLKTEILLFLANRAQHVEEVVKPALEQGKVVLCDRFDGSTFAYQHFARGFDWDRLKEWNDWVKDYLEPDLVIFLDIEPEEGIKRKSQNFTRIDKETMEFHKKVREGYYKLLETNNNWVKIDGIQNIESIHKEIIGSLEKFLGLKSLKPRKFKFNSDL